MKGKVFFKVLAVGAALAFCAQSAYAEKVLKLGTVGFKGMPIGDAIDQALIPTLEEVSGGEMKIEPHYRKSLCSEQTCGEQANQGLIALWTSSTANFGNFGTALSVFDLPVPYDWAQLYQGLQTGVVSGQYVATPWQHVAKLHEVAKYFTEIGGSWSGNQLSMDKRQYDALSDQEKEWLHTAATAFGKHVQEPTRLCSVFHSRGNCESATGESSGCDVALSGRCAWATEALPSIRWLSQYRGSQIGKASTAPDQATTLMQTTPGAVRLGMARFRG